MYVQNFSGEREKHCRSLLGLSYFFFSPVQSVNSYIQHHVVSSSPALASFEEGGVLIVVIVLLLQGSELDVLS